LRSAFAYQTAPARNFRPRRVSLPTRSTGSGSGRPVTTPAGMEKSRPFRVPVQAEDRRAVQAETDTQPEDAAAAARLEVAAVRRKTDRDTAGPRTATNHAGRAGGLSFGVSLIV